MVKEKRKPTRFTLMTHFPLETERQSRRRPRKMGLLNLNKMHQRMHLSNFLSIENDSDNTSYVAEID